MYVSSHHLVQFSVSCIMPNLARGKKKRYSMLGMQTELMYILLGKQVFLTDMANFAEMNATYEKYFTHKPARSCVAVAQLPKGVPVEIEAIALQ